MAGRADRRVQAVDRIRHPRLTAQAAEFLTLHTEPVTALLLGTCPVTIDRPAMRQRWERLTFLHVQSVSGGGPGDRSPGPPCWWFPSVLDCRLAGKPLR